MLRRLKVRTRLVAVLALPLVLLLAVVIPEVLDRSARAEDADRAEDLAVEAAHVAAAVDALQGERVLSAASRAGADQVVGSALADQRALVDGVAGRAAQALTRISQRAPELASATARAATQLAALDDVRAETDAARSIVPWVDPYLALLDPLLTLQDDLASVVGQAGVGDDLAHASLVARAKEAAAAQSAQLAAAAAWGGLRGDQVRILAGLRADEMAYRTAYLAAAAPDDRADRRAEVQAGGVTTAGRVVDAVIAERDLDSAGSLSQWLDLSAERQVVLREVEESRATDALDHAQALGDESRRASTAFAGLAAGGLVLAVALALLAARSITGPLRKLTDAADQLAEERLPRLVDSLRHPGDEDDRYLLATLELLEVRSDDELAHLAKAFNAVQAVAVDVAAEQSLLLRKGISDLYVNLARRNQALIERQIRLLDELEVGEQDPDTLEHLYQLDHLATRMRRNAESLLVLAGADSSPRRARSVDIVDVVRAAVSEVEDYERVDLGALAGATLQGAAVSDVAHIVAELLENATQFSAPDTAVRVDGIRTGGSYQLVISDHGVGMAPDQLDSFNAILRDPPVTGLALGRSLGCLVAARLAARHGITVRLRAGEHDGVSAYVILPRHLIEDHAPEPWPEPADEVDIVRLEAPSPEPVQPAWPAPASPEAWSEDPGDLTSWSAPPPARLRDALPVPGAFDADLQALLDGDAPPAPVEPPIDQPADAPAVDRSDSDRAPRPDDSLEAGVDAPVPRHVRLEPDASDPGTTAPLPRRGRDDTVVPAAEARTAGGLPRRAAATASRAELPAPEPARQLDEPGTPSGPPARRSPDEVRALLSRYRSGLQAGRSGDVRDGEERS